MLTKNDIEEIGEVLIERIYQEMEAIRPKGHFGRTGNSIATGNLKRSLRVGVIESDEKFNLQIISLDYLGNLDAGRKPGKRPPLKEIADWIKTKGLQASAKTRNLSEAERTKQLTWAIAISIKKRGIKKTDIVKSVIDEVLLEVVNQVTSRGAMRLEKQIEVDFDTILPKEAVIKM